MSFVEALRSASPYIHRHRGKTFVVLVGGEAARERSFAPLMRDVALLHGLGVRVVLVHGTRPQIDRRLKSAGQESTFHQSIRITDRQSMRSVFHAVGSARHRFEAQLSSAAAGLRVMGSNALVARPIGVCDGVDYLFTGEVRRVDVDAIRAQLDAGALVLISPLGYSPTGEAFNLASHEVARSVAVAMGADKLIGMIEARGIVDGRRRLITRLTPTQAEAMLAKKGKNGNDARKHLTAASAAVARGVSRAHLVDRRKDGALLEELFTASGSGTLITCEPHEVERCARVEDVLALSKLLKPLEEDGVLVRRSHARIEMEIERFTVLFRDEKLVGCAALESFEEEEVGELYALAVSEAARRSGLGEHLLESIEGRARDAGLRRLFVLTTHTADFFQERGFVQKNVRALPKRRRTSYDRARRSRVLVKEL